MANERDAFWQRCFSETEPDYKKLPADITAPVIEQLRRNNCQKLLDLGCGFGKWAVTFAEAGFDVCAVDIAAPAIEYVRKWAARDKLVMKTVVSSAQVFVRPGAYDAIWCNSVLDHLTLDATRLALVNIELSLKENGLVYLSFDGRDEEEEKGTVILPDGTRKYTADKKAGMLWRFYSEAEIRSLISQMEIIDFTISSNGKRHVWLRKE